MSDLLKGRYELLSKLGSGGFSTVFRAHDVLLDREVAIKILKASLHEDQELVQRFLLEAKLTSKLSHPNTLTVHDFGRDDEGHCFLVSELLVGKSLHERLHQARITAREALQITAQVALGLQEAHSKEVVHRDIKPGNIFLMRSHDPHLPHIKLLDFGIAKSVGLEGHTVTGQMMGTPTYMSPEQIVNIKEVDHRTDIYSLGVVFFHMLCGTPPFKGESYWDTMRMHMQDRVPALSLAPQTPSLSQAVVNAIAQILNRMMAKEKSKRPQSAEEVYQQLSIILQVITRDEEQGRLSQFQPSQPSQSSAQRAQPQRLSSPASISKSLATPAPPLSAQSVQTAKKATSPTSASVATPSNTPSNTSSNTPSNTAVSQSKTENSKPSFGSFSFLNAELNQNISLPEPTNFEEDLAEYQADLKRTVSGMPNQIFDTTPNTPPLDPFAPSIELRTQPLSESRLTSEDLVLETSLDLRKEIEREMGGGNPIRSLRILILDPNEYAGEVYQRGLTQGSERRAQQLESQGLKQTELLSVSLSRNEQELFEDLGWGANLILLDLKARDGTREQEGLMLLKDLHQKIPSGCHIIAICKDRNLTLDAIEAGADAVLVKPVRNQELFQAASVYLWGDQS